MEEAQQHHNDYMTLVTNSRQIQAIHQQIDVTRQEMAMQQALPQQVSEAVTQAISTSIPQAVSNGIQQGLSQATSMPLQPHLMPMQHTLSPLDMQAMKHNIFLNDWNALPDFNKNYFFQFPDAFPVLFPQHAQDWYQLSENTRHMIGSNPFQFLATFPPFLA